MDDRNNSSRYRNRDERRRFVTPPTRRFGSAPTASPAPPIQVPKQPASTDPEDLARVRENLGFDDIPVDDENMEGVRFRDIFRAWAKQAVKDSPIEKKLKAATKKKGRLHDLKNDLKWAMQADLDEPVKKVKKDPENNLSKPVAHTSLSHPTPLSPSSAHSSKTIDININLGSLPKLPPITKVSARAKSLIAKIRGFHWTRRRIVIVTALLIMSGGIASWYFIPSLYTSKKSGSGTAVSTGTIQKPDYSTALPKDKSIESLGGWRRVSPSDRSPVFAYADKIGDVAISVSQQPIPESFKPNVDDSVAELAKNYAATEKISVGSLTLYVGTSAEGPQSAILAKDDLLILMKSTKKIDSRAWADYVQSLVK
jgi:hypothetical protein